MRLIFEPSPILIASRRENSILTLPSLQPAAPPRHIQRLGGLLYFPLGQDGLALQAQGSVRYGASGHTIETNRILGESLADSGGQRTK
jgi:hypothetical protein